MPPENRTSASCAMPIVGSVVQHRSTATSSAAGGYETLQLAADLAQRPSTAFLPRVRIEGVRGSNPLSSTIALVRHSEADLQAAWPAEAVRLGERKMGAAGGP